MKGKKIKILFITICIIQLFYLLNSRSGFKYEIIKNPFGKDSGISYALSSQVIESNNIIKKHKLADFNLSNDLVKDTYFYQRSIEFNYPIRLNQNSKFIFYFVEEAIPDNCQIIDVGEYLQLTKC